MSKETVLLRKPKAVVERRIEGIKSEYRIIDPTGPWFGMRKNLSGWCSTEDRAWTDATQSLFTRSLDKMDE